MNRSQLFRTALRAQALALQLFNIDTKARAGLIKRPPNFHALVAEARVLTLSIGLAVESERARKRFHSR